MLVKSDKQLV